MRGVLCVMAKSGPPSSGKEQLPHAPQQKHLAYSPSDAVKPVTARSTGAYN